MLLLMSDDDAWNSRRNGECKLLEEAASTGVIFWVASLKLAKKTISHSQSTKDRVKKLYLKKDTVMDRNAIVVAYRL